MLGGSGGSPRSCKSPGRTTLASIELKRCQPVSCSHVAGARRGTCLFDLPSIALVCAGYIVCQRFRTSKVMVRARCGDNIALAGDLAGEASDWASDLVDLAEEKDTREAAG